jgi:hypothetical protein
MWRGGGGEVATAVAVAVLRCEEVVGLPLPRSDVKSRW